ncbi:MAG: biotin--[acetyl-CoA-carboxylase] ligase [Christensenellaceae bacterium]|nr:biotin--[acetyl-CoA-carboxylase] ligase [Christensenellaceae bacterium]
MIKRTFCETMSDAVKEAGFPEATVMTVTDSTNEIAKKLIQKGAENWTAVIAQSQTAGKGRLGKRFFSPKDTGAYVSVIIDSDAYRASYLTIIAALATAKTVEEFCGFPAKIKWVNDVFVSDRKCAGILCESAVVSGKTRYVAGIGTNLSDPDEGFPDEISASAGSLGFLTDKRPKYIVSLLKNLKEEFDCFDKKYALVRYRDASFLTGKHVTVKNAYGGNYDAYVLDITDDFGLAVQKPDGATEILKSGVVSIEIKRQ